MFHKLKSWLYEVLIADLNTRPLARLNLYLDAILTLLSIISIILLTVDGISAHTRTFFIIIQIISTVYFSLTYILRIWVANIDDRYKKTLRGRLRYMLTPYMIIDLISILPYLTYLIWGPTMQAIWILQIGRIFKLFRFKKIKAAITLIVNVIKRERDALGITLFVVILLIVIAGFIMYYLENPAQPDVFSSIPKSMWWAVITLTTIGYGDMYPVTPVGQMIGSIVALCGIGIIALPSGIIASGFSKEISKYRAQVEKVSK